MNPIKNLGHARSRPRLGLGRCARPASVCGPGRHNPHARMGGPGPGGHVAQQLQSMDFGRVHGASCSLGRQGTVHYRGSQDILYDQMIQHDCLA